MTRPFPEFLPWDATPNPGRIPWEQLQGWDLVALESREGNPSAASIPALTFAGSWRIPTGNSAGQPLPEAVNIPGR